LAKLKTRATFCISPSGILNTSLKAFTSSTVTTPSAFAILAPSTITPTVNATSLSAGPSSSRPIGSPPNNPAAAPANFPQTDIAEFPRLKLTGAYGFGVGTHMENRDGQVRFVLAKKVCVSLSANEGGIFAALARASSSPVNPRESDQHAADEKYVTLGQLPGQQFARWVC
jgi:hypothetical protein